MIPRILPFAVYLGVLLLHEGLARFHGLLRLEVDLLRTLDLFLYPVQIAVVAGLLIRYWPDYRELHSRPAGNWKDILLVVGSGLAVYLAWVRIDWTWAVQGRSAGYDPFVAGGQVGVVLAGVRLLGATVVVPIMEELFWRSFLLRWLIAPRFETVHLGTVTPFSALITIALFGSEHHEWLAGLFAGGVYTWLLYQTGRLWPCILAHATTNLALGVHVLHTEEWWWW